MVYAAVSFEPGTFVRLKSDHERSGIVEPGGQTLAGRKMVPVLLAAGQRKYLPVDALEIVPAARESLEERFSTGNFVDVSWLKRMLTQIRVTGRVDEIVYSMQATNTDFYPYQFKPVLKLLNSPTNSLLIADEVGLGKTIEAGLIWTELRARLDCRRLLIVCPKTLREKWRRELRKRFGVQAVLVDAASLQELLENEAQRGGEFAAIATLQGLMPPKNWNEPEEEGVKPRGRARRNLAKYLESASEQEPVIDLFVVDEAHHMRNPETTYFKLGQLLNDVSSHRLYLSATPIHLRNRDLHSLFSLIDPDTFEFEHTLEDLILSNKPIVHARDKLLAGDADKSEILELIEQAKLFDILSENRALKLVETKIASSSLSKSERSEIAYRLEEANQMSNYMTRTRRRDVEELRIVREATPLLFEMKEVEREFYQQVTDAVVDYALDSGANARFLLASPLRLLTSSPAAASAYWAVPKTEDLGDFEETDDDLTGEDIDRKPLFSRLRQLATDLALSEKLARSDTKFDELIKHLGQFWAEYPNEKVILFSQFKPTLRYLSRRLSEIGIDHEVIHGDVKENRDAVLDRFAASTKSKILLSSEVGSEGVDLQFCWVVINYDLPWNPMRVEQRIGRVDRHGQKNPKVLIVNLLYQDTIDAEIYRRLYERLKLSENALGGFEAVLGEPIREMERKLLDPKLTSDQRLAAIDQAAQAAENMRIENDNLEAEAGALIQHGDYVIQKIYEARDLQRWLSEHDILVFVKTGLDDHFPGCLVEEAPVKSGEYRITLTENARDQLAKFMARRRGKANTKIASNDPTRRYKFTSSVATEESANLEYISQFHPLVRLIVAMEALEGRHARAEAVAAKLAVDECGGEIAAGEYVVAIMQWDIHSEASGRSDFSKIAYASTEISKREIIDHDLAERLAVCVANSGSNIVNMSQDPRLLPASDVLTEIVKPHIKGMYNEFVERAEANVKDRVEIRLRALKRHRTSKLANLEEQKSNHLERARLNELNGDVKAAQRFRALASAAEKGAQTLKANLDFRIKQIEQQRDIIPELTEVAFLFVEVAA